MRQKEALFPSIGNYSIIFTLFQIMHIAVFCRGSFKESTRGYNSTFLEKIGVTVEDYDKGSWFGNSSSAANEIFQNAVISPKGCPKWSWA